MSLSHAEIERLLAWYTTAEEEGATRDEDDALAERLHDLLPPSEPPSETT